MSEPVLGWHFLADNGMTTAHPQRPAVRVEVGQTLHEERPLALCQVGLHASRRALDALQYASGATVCRVRLTGDVLEGEDKLCASQRTVLALADATALLHEFACWCAEEALERERAVGREPDACCWAVIEAKRQWLRGEITDKELAAAWDAARAAAWAAARGAARDAASAAAWAAAWGAAWGAARAAAWAAASAAAWAAASAAAWDAAWGAARGAAWDAASAAAWDAARGAAWGAASAAAWGIQNEELERRLYHLLALPEESHP